MSGEQPGPGEVIDRAVHDLNNVCATIFGFASLASDDAPDGSVLAQYLAEITAAAERCGAVAQRLHLLANNLRGRE